MNYFYGLLLVVVTTIVLVYIVGYHVDRQKAANNNEIKTKTVGGYLFLSCATVQNAPKFFSVFSLCLRAADWEVVLLRELGAYSDKFIESWEIPFTTIVDPPTQLAPPNAMVDRVQKWKTEKVIGMTGGTASPGNRYPTVVWIDDDFGRWMAPKVPERIVTLNWQAVSQKLRTSGGLAKVGLG